MNFFKKHLKICVCACLSVLLITASFYASISAINIANEIKEAKDFAELKASDAENRLSDIEGKAASNPAYAAAMVQLSALKGSVENISNAIFDLSQSIYDINTVITETKEDIPTNMEKFPFVNVRDYGAYPDDGKDDTRALQRAIDAAKGGGTVYFPMGEYELSWCLLFYSNQCLYFENGAVLKRMSDTLTALLANYTDATWGEYSATENVDIIGATFDGNSQIDHKITMLNTGHCRNIRVKNCTFRNGHTGNYYECNSSEYVTVENCVFEHYSKSDSGTDEYIQIDLAKSGNYGVIDSVFGEEEFKFDNTVCRYIEIRGCTFDLEGCKSSAIGNHSDGAHNNIKIYDNLFVGNGSTDSRGVIYFVSSTYGVEIYSNIFVEATTGVQTASEKAVTLIVRNNRFESVYYTVKGSVIEYNNIVDGVLR